MYTIAVCCVLIGVFVLDVLLRTRLYRKAKFWWFQAVVAGMTIVFDAIANVRIWAMNPARSSGFSIGVTPIETVLFGFALVYLNLVLFEYRMSMKRTDRSTPYEAKSSGSAARKHSPDG